MDDIPHQPNSSHSKASLPTFTRSIPLEIAALPASTRTSFTRVDDTRPGTAAGGNSNNHLPDDPPVPVPGSGDGNGRGGADGADAPPPEGEQEEEETGAVVPPQVPQTLVQFLLVSGRRRSMAFDPETTVGRVKELVWNTWPNGTLSFTPATLPTHEHAARLCHMVHKVCRGDPTRLRSYPSFLFIHFLLFILLRTEPYQFFIDVWDFSLYP